MGGRLLVTRWPVKLLVRSSTLSVYLHCGTYVLRHLEGWSGRIYIYFWLITGGTDEDGKHITRLSYEARILIRYNQKESAERVSITINSF